MQPRDFLMTDPAGGDYDLKIADGDFVLGEVGQPGVMNSTETQNVILLALLHAGALRQFPLAGAGLPDSINGSESLKQGFDEQLRADGCTLVRMQETQLGQLQVFVQR